LLRSGVDYDDSLIELLGAPKEVVKEHIESQFDGKMSWEKAEEWDIDHRRPCASFDLEDYEQLKMCFHYTNLQPLSSYENRKKSAKFDESTFGYFWTGDRWERK
jgi:hypothetical protein